MKLIVSIVERGKGTHMQRLYRSRQVFLQFQCTGKGTATSEILNILGLDSTEKDVVLSWTAAAAADCLLRDLDTQLRGSTGTSGIVFDLTLGALSSLAANLAAYQTESLKKTNGGKSDMEQKSENSLILVVCRRGCTDEVMSTAKAHGARGGTVIRGRLSGIEELEEAYDLNLKAEREIVAIVVPKELRGPIMEAVNAAHGLRSEAQAVLCSLPIEHIVHLG